ncbi:MAG: hypothetical protein JO072_15720 [Parafilimonas sp.]|nr:hypothetical protein [Parafilimonas sp.]
MREIFTDKNFRLSKILLLIKILLVVSLIIFFLPLIILPFFNHPCADDYFYGFQLNKNGFAAYQQFIYNNWDGRFAQTFITSLFINNNFLFSHYYLHSLLLLALNILSVFSVINVLFKFILKEKRNFSYCLMLSLIFTALEISCIPECSTFMFWFSSAITYQLPVIFLQLEIALLIAFFNSSKNKHAIYALFIALSVILTIGLNELFLVVQLLIFLSIIFISHKRKKVILILFILSFLSAAAIIVFAPGNKVRISDIDSKGFIVGALSVCYHSAETIWYIFKTPFIWFASAAVFLYAQEVKRQWQSNIYIEKLNQKWLLPVFIIIFLIGSIMLPVIALKGGIIPERYLNALICCLIPLLFIAVFIAGNTTKHQIILSATAIKKIVIYSLLVIGILCNTYIVDAYKSIMIAPVYNSILSERETALKRASSTNKIAVVKNYNLALSELMNSKYSKATATIQQIIIQKPPLLFFQDDLQTYNSIDILRKYYGLDSITVKKAPFQ